MVTCPPDQRAAEQPALCAPFWACKAQKTAIKTEKQAFLSKSPRFGLASLHLDCVLKALQGLLRPLRANVHRMTSTSEALNGVGRLNCLLTRCAFSSRDLGIRLHLSLSCRHPLASWIERFLTLRPVHAMSFSFDHVGRCTDKFSAVLTISALVRRSDIMSDTSIIRTRLRLHQLLSLR